MPSTTASVCLLYADSSTFVRHVAVTTDRLYVGAEAERQGPPQSQAIIMISMCSIGIWYKANDFMRKKRKKKNYLFNFCLLVRWVYRGVIPGGAGEAVAPPTFLANNTFFGVSHTTDRKVPSEVVLMGSFMSVI